MDKQHFSMIPAKLNRQFFTSEEWHIIDFSSKINIVNYSSGSCDQVCTALPHIAMICHFVCYLKAVYTVVIKRRTEYFVLTAILPCLVIGTIEIVTFLVPFDETARLDLSFTCLLAYLMFQMMIIDQLPKSAENPPLLLLLTSLFTIYIGVAIIFQSICIYLVDITKYDAESKPSRTIQKLAIGLAEVIAPDYLRQYKSKVDRKVKVSPSVENGTHIGTLFFLPETLEAFTDLNFERISVRGYRKHDEGDWILVAKVIDKAAFIIFITLLVGTVVVLLVFVPLAYQWGMVNS